MLLSTAVSTFLSMALSLLMGLMMSPALRCRTRCTASVAVPSRLIDLGKLPGPNQESDGDRVDVLVDGVEGVDDRVVDVLVDFGPQTPRML